MAKQKKQTEIKNVTDTQKAVDELRGEISKMSMQLTKAQLKNTTSLRTKRDELARLLTRLSMEKFMNKKEEVK